MLKTIRYKSGPLSDKSLSNAANRLRKLLKKSKVKERRYSRHDDVNIVELYDCTHSDHEFIDYFAMPHRTYLKKWSHDTYVKLYVNR